MLRFKYSKIEILTFLKSLYLLLYHTLRLFSKVIDNNLFFERKISKSIHIGWLQALSQDLRYYIFVQFPKTETLYLNKIPIPNYRTTL